VCPGVGRQGDQWQARCREAGQHRRAQEVELAKDGKRLILRTPTTGIAGRLFQAARIALPPNTREADAAA